MHSRLLTAALLVAPLTGLHAADPVAVDLATRTWQGIPGLERTPRGRVFVSWFTGGPREPAPDNTVVLSFSDDDGRTFSPPEAMALPLSDGTRCYDPCLWIDARGRLWYLFNRSVKDSTRHGVYARICDDPDASPPVWGAEFRVGFDGPFSFRMNKPVVLSTGEWVMPVVHALEPVAGWAGFDPRQVHGAAISSDEGRTWTLHGAVQMPAASLENMIVELRDGRLWMLIRTGKVLWESHSADRGRTWTEAAPTTIATPHSRFFIRRLASGNLLLVNHHRFTGRSHLTAQLSTDDGKTWNDGLLLDERGGVSYPDGVQDANGLVWITYDRDRNGAGEILLARFREEDVAAGRDVSGAVDLKHVVNRLREPPLVPTGWDPALAGDEVLRRLVRVTAPHVKGAHDAEFVCVGDRAYVVEHDNDVAPGHGAGKAMYCVLTVVNLGTLAVEKTHLLAKAGQAFANTTLPDAQIFVPRIIRRDEHTLRTFFCSQPTGAQAVTWYRDFDLRTQTFEDRIHRARLRTAAGTFDMEPRHFHADAVAAGFTRPAVDHGLYIFDSFKEFDGRTYVALNNFPGRQNALAVLDDDLTTFEVIGHYNEPQAEQLSESAVNRLPDGTWLAICRNDAGNYHFTTSRDGRAWTVGEPRPFVPNGLNSKPTFDRFGDTYYLGWQENTRVGGCNRSVFNIDISRDGETWARKYRFETPHSFQYPTFHEHEGTIWLTVTQSDHGGSSDRIMFGRLEAVGGFEPQEGKERIEWPAPPPPPPAIMKRGVKLFTDRDYALDEMPDAVRDLPFLRTSIERTDMTVTRPGTLFALTPTVRPGAASLETALAAAGFSRVDVPEAQLFPGEINRVGLWRKAVRAGERLRFQKLVLLVLAEGVQVREHDPLAPAVIVDPGADFQDAARPGAMIIGMDRTPRGRLWGCWTGTGDKKDGYFLLATSDDGGSTWSRPRLAVGARTEAGQRVHGALVGNLWTDPQGRLWLFFDQQLGDPQGRITNWWMRCDDPDAAAPTWTEPVMFAEGCTLNKPTVLASGDWLVPVSDWQRKTARVFASTDSGATFKERGSLRFPDWEFDEHMMVELKDGRLWMLARTKGQPFESFSADGGATWSEPRQAATVQNLNARFFLRRLRSGRILLVKNGSPAERLPQRSHLTAWLSEDEGRTWQGGLLLDERAAVSYPDGFEAPDGLIHVLYDWNRHTDAEILLATFREADVLAGRPVSPDTKLGRLVNKATGPKAERLFNGIELPDIWPPRFRDPASVEPMDVPYLRRPPRVIPIDVGRQLFVDDFLVQETTLGRTYHRPEKFAGNPVFRAETPRELAGAVEGRTAQTATVYTGHGGLFFDPHDSVFRLFYTAGWRGPLAVATSPDLVQWTRPDLGLAGDNCLLPEGRRWTGPALESSGSDDCVWLDLAASDPAERIRFLTCWMHVPQRERPRGFTHTLHVSDGRTWSAGRPTGMAEDYCSFFFNPFRGVWVFSIKQGGPRGRCRQYSENKDFLAGADWSRAVYWTNADRLDPPEPAGGYPGAGEPPQLYSLNAVAYESLMLGMHMIHRGPRNEVCDQGGFPKLSDLHLGFSRDGFHWDRPDRRPFIAAARTEGAWDRAYVHPTTGVLVVLDDRLVFPYCAFSGIAPDGQRGMYTGGSVGLAMLRRDGFASMDGPGALTTRPLEFAGRHLFVNVRGRLRVEVLDGAGAVLAESVEVAGDDTRRRVAWAGPGDRRDLADLAGRPVRLRFTLPEGSLYAFWVTADAGGASHGYLGAGGPSHGGVRDVAPTAGTTPGLRLTP